MLVSAAAKRWNVDPASCRAQSGEVLHAPTGKSITYGGIVTEAARMPVPETVALKRPEDFKLIGTPAKRLDAPAKVNGTAVYGIDVRPPGAKIATLTQSPVFGGRVKRVNDRAAKVVKGVRQIVRLDDAVAVVADHMGAAKKGLAALVIEWDEGPHAKLDTQDIVGELEKATLNSGPVAQNIGDIDKAAVKPASRCYQRSLVDGDRVQNARTVRAVPIDLVELMLDPGISFQPFEDVINACPQTLGKLQGRFGLRFKRTKVALPVKAEVQCRIENGGGIDGQL